MRRLVARIAEFGWHLEVHIDAEGLEHYAQLLAGLNVRVVIDHMANLPGAAGPEQPAFKRLLALAQSHGWFIKVSGVDRCSQIGPRWPDAMRLLTATVAALPCQVVWGTDWPHTEYTSAPPADRLLLEELLASLTSGSVRHVLVENPARLYGWLDKPPSRRSAPDHP